MGFYGGGAIRRVLKSAAVMCRPGFEEIIHIYIQKKKIVLIPRV